MEKQVVAECNYWVEVNNSVGSFAFAGTVPSDFAESGLVERCTELLQFELPEFGAVEIAFVPVEAAGSVLLGTGVVVEHYPDQFACGVVGTEH